MCGRAGKGHGKAVDWWSIGILVYEMLAGRPPFNNKSRGQLQKQIMAAKLKLPRVFYDLPSADSMPHMTLTYHLHKTDHGCQACAFLYQSPEKLDPLAPCF